MIELSSLVEQSTAPPMIDSSHVEPLSSLKSPINQNFPVTHTSSSYGDMESPSCRAKTLILGC